MPPAKMSLNSVTNPVKPAPGRSHYTAVLGVALGLRLLVVWTTVTRFPPQWFFMRGMEMGLLAKSLLAGQGLSSPFGPPTGPTAFVAPAYPILVALVFKVFGSFTTASEIVILSAQTALNLATVWLIMHIARKLFNQTAATIAGLIWGCSLPLLWMPTIFWETSLSCLLLTGLIALVVHYRDQPVIRLSQWVTIGAFCGIASLVNPALLPSLVAIVIWIIYSTGKKPLRGPLLTALTFLLVFSPWPIRNARIFHAFIPLRTTVGFELWMGNHAGSTGFLDESLFPTFNSTELAEYRTEGEVRYTRHKSELATQYICSHPAQFIKLTLRRAVRFWTGTGTAHGSIFFAIHAVFTTLLGVSGLLLLLRKSRLDLVLLFSIPFILFPLPYLLTHAEFRYRIVIDPLLTICSAYAVTESCKFIASARRLSSLSENTTKDLLIQPA